MPFSSEENFLPDLYRMLIYFFSRFPFILASSISIKIVTPRFLIAEVYKFQSETLNFLWSDSLPQNTINSIDFASALFQTSLWALKVGRVKALELAGENLASALSESGSSESKEELALIKGIEGVASKEEEVKVVIFNVVDENDTNQSDIAKVIGNVS